MLKILYVYEERIPEMLRNLVRNSMPHDEFSLEEITYSSSEDEWITKLSRADVVLFAPGRHVPDNILEHARHVKLMQLWSSGYDKFNTAACTRLGIPVANNGGANASSVAEHAVLLMLATYRRLPDSHRRAATGSWSGNSHGLDMRMIEGKKIGIIGFGNIGRYVAKKLGGFDAQLMYFDVKRAPLEVENGLKVDFVTFENLLKTSDIVTLHLHHNKDTERIIDEAAFSTMKDGAILINVSRAQLVDQDALYNALRSGKLHGAGIDVYMNEPTTGKEPLLSLPNVVATPHTAGSTYDTYVTVMSRVVDNFRRISRGEAPQWVVNNL